MPFYDFKRQDNDEIITKMFSISECPKFIECQDGVIAHKVISAPNVSMFGKNGSVMNSSKLNNDMKKRQEKADKRMRERWKSVKSK